MTGHWKRGPSYTDPYEPQPTPDAVNSWGRGSKDYVATWGQVDETYWNETGGAPPCSTDEHVGDRTFLEVHATSSGGYIFQSSHANYAINEGYFSYPTIGGHKNLRTYGHWQHGMPAGGRFFLLGRHQAYDFCPYHVGGQDYPYIDTSTLDKAIGSGGDCTFRIKCWADSSVRYFRLEMHAEVEASAEFKAKWTTACIRKGTALSYSYWGKYVYERVGEITFIQHCDEDVANPLVAGLHSATHRMKWTWDVTALAPNDDGKYIDDSAQNYQPGWSDGNTSNLSATLYSAFMGAPDVEENTAQTIFEFYPSFCKGYWTDPDEVGTHLTKCQIGFSVMAIGKTVTLYEDNVSNYDPVFDHWHATGFIMTPTEWKIEAICGQPANPKTTNPFTSGEPGTGHNSIFASAIQNLIDHVIVEEGYYDAATAAGSLVNDTVFRAPIQTSSDEKTKHFARCRYVPSFSMKLYAVPKERAGG